MIKEELLKQFLSICFKILDTQIFNIKSFELEILDCPQNRDHVLYIVGFLDAKINFDFPIPCYKKTKVGDILEQYQY